MFLNVSFMEMMTQNKKCLKSTPRQADSLEERKDARFSSLQPGNDGGKEVESEERKRRKETTENMLRTWKSATEDMKKVKKVKEKVEKRRRRKRKEARGSGK